MKYLIVVTAFFFTTSLTAIAAENEDSFFLNESEAGILLTTGNAESRSLNFGHTTTYTFDDNLLSFTASYLESTQNGRRGAQNWQAALRYERELTTRFAGFVSQGIFGNRPQGIERRFDTDAGGKYYFVKSENLSFFAEAGYRYSLEKQVAAPDKKTHRARAYTEAGRDWTEQVKTDISLEYLQDFEDQKNWQLNTGIALSVVLSPLLSLKSSYIVRYNHEPLLGKKTTDSFLTTALVAKY